MHLPDLRADKWIGTSYREGFRLPSSELTYGVFQKERCPTTQRIHAQFFVILKKRQRLTGVKKLFPGDHVEIARNPKEARAYCMKEDTRVSSPVEEGTFPNGDKNQVIIQLARQMRTTQVLELRPDLWRSLRLLDDLRLRLVEPRSELTTGVLLTGLSGTGKSKIAGLISAFVGANEAYWHDGDKWWNGYDGQCLVVVDEFRGQYTPSFLLRLLDRYPMKVEYKGGYAQFNTKLVILTSNLSIEAMYPGIDQRTLDAFKRRLLIFNLN